MIRIGAVLLLLPAACEDYPRDTAATSDRVRGGALRVGLVAGDAHSPVSAALVRALAARTGSTPRETVDAAEPLLLGLEKGELDLVIGGFDPHTPWSRRVTFSRPLTAGDPIEHKVATRNGEHRWAMDVDRAVAAVTRPPAR